MELAVKLLTDSAKPPTYGSPEAAGLDLYSDCDLVVPSRQRTKISTGIAIEFKRSTDAPIKSPCELLSLANKSHYMRIAARSGLSVNKNIDIGAGVIDSDYRGEIIVCLINNGDEEFVVNKGDKIAQMILTRYDRFQKYTVNNNLSSTQRGCDGFGSTGTK